MIYGSLWKNIGKVLRGLCEQNKIELVEGHAMTDHIHLLVSIPPKFSVSNTVGYLKGKSAIRIHREYLGQQRNFTGFHFWAKGYCVSTDRNRRTSHPRLHSTSGRGRKTRGGATTAPAIGPRGAFTRFIDPFEGSSSNRVLWARYLIVQFYI